MVCSNVVKVGVRNFGLCILMVMMLFGVWLCSEGRVCSIVFSWFSILGMCLCSVLGKGFSWNISVLILLFRFLSVGVMNFCMVSLGFRKVLLV